MRGGGGRGGGAGNGGNRGNTGGPFRRRAGKVPDPDRYRRRGMVEGYSAPGRRAATGCAAGTGESARERFGIVLAIARDAGALNRIRRTVGNGRMPTMA